MSPTEAIALLSPAPIRTPNPTQWADLGAGSGLFTLALATLLQPGSTIFAVDRQPKIWDQKTSNGITIGQVKDDFVKSHLLLRDLDGILMANSLHYVRDKLALLGKLQTYNLKKQHALLIIEYDSNQPHPIWVPHPINYASLRNLIHDAGYRNITRLADHPSIYNRTPIYSAYIT